LINISINLGPGAIWAAMVFIVFWVGVGFFRAGRDYERMSHEKGVQRRRQQMLLAPHIAPGPPLLPRRVDPGLALLSRYTPIEEEEAA
jgi:hypothetical protein